MAADEDATWETGRCSGTMYCGDHDHYDFLNEAFSLFSHVNVLQRDMCPSATRFESEIIAMTSTCSTPRPSRGPIRSDSSRRGAPGASATPCSPTATMLVRRGVTRPNVIKPETAHPASTRLHLFGIELRSAPVDPVTTGSTPTGWPAPSTTRRSPSSARPATTGTAPSTRSGAVGHRLERGIGLHVDGCLGGWILPFGQELGYDIPLFDFRVPGVTSSRRTPTSTATP